MLGQTCISRAWANRRTRIISPPNPTGRGPADAIRHGLAQAGLTPQDVNHVNAHGTGTPQNNLVESIAIGAVLGDAVPITSTKPMTGHLLGAAGIARQSLR